MLDPGYTKGAVLLYSHHPDIFAAVLLFLNAGNYWAQRREFYSSAFNNTKWVILSDSAAHFALKQLFRSWLSG